MKIGINKDGKVQDIDLNLKGRHTKKVIKHFSKLTDGNDEDSKKEAGKYFDVLESIAVEATGMSEAELDNLDADDKNKIINAIQEKSLSSINFLKSSLK